MDLLAQPSWVTSSRTLALTLVLLPLSALVYLCFFYVDYPKIKGVPEIPGASFLAGHLYKLGSDHATTAEKWSLENKWPVFQIRMGNRRAIVLNTFESARDWIVKNQSATLDRPWFYTFHKVVSATSAATIGTSPWNERTKKQRRIVGSLTTSPSIQKLRNVLDLEICGMISGMYYDSQKGEVDIMPHVYQKRVALNLMTMFCYATRFSSVDDPLFLQILSDASKIASFRSTNANPQDFIPHLRYLPGNGRTTEAVEVRARRDRWLANMLDKARSNIGKRVGKQISVAEMLLTDNQEGLTHHDIKTILGGLMSGGFETIYSTAIITIGVLATPAGQDMQKRAYEDIMSVYETPEKAFELCLTEEKSPYVEALVKEALRFYPPLKLLPARQVYKDFVYQGSVIPQGVLIYINTQAINHDKAIYGDDAGTFRPERWMGQTSPIPPPYHFSFGAGARMCTAVNLSNRVLYAMFVRLIVSFKFAESKSMPANTDYIQYKRNAAESNAIASNFKVRLTPRDERMLEKCFQVTQKNTTDLVSEEYTEVLKRD